VVCGLRDVYRGVWGCPAWAAGKPCSYCFLKGTVRGKDEMLKGVAWVDPCIPCKGTGETSWSKHGDADDRLTKTCSACAGAGIGQYPEMRHVHNARAAVEKWLGTNPHTLCEHQGTKTAGEPCSNPGLWCDPPMLLNAGEYTDSLGFSPEENPHVGMLLDLFSDPETNPHGQKLLLVSKAGLEAAKAHLVGRQPSENVILSWSMGQVSLPQGPWHEEFGRRWQECVDIAPAWPCAAVLWAIRAGWRVRVRLDPMITEGSWGIWLCDALSGEKPELITLGTLRHKGGRVALPDEERVGIYRQAIDGLREGGYEGPVGLCKETPDMIRTVLGIEPHEMRCNCLP